MADYERFMRDEHIPDLLETGLFTDAALMSDGNGIFRIVYVCGSRTDLESYLTRFADAMRQKSLDRFPTGVEVSRTEWNVLETWEC
jgi:hypothetical protein